LSVPGLQRNLAAWRLCVKYFLSRQAAKPQSSAANLIGNAVISLTQTFLKKCVVSLQKHFNEKLSVSVSNSV
ncbi:MAG: hypothetical protein Q4G59_05890, partial [Planctomycetia bacterium]|nr:hypothetical protein [Planctomycetia bacterium]